MDPLSIKITELESTLSIKIGKKGHTFRNPGLNNNSKAKNKDE